MSYIAKIYLNKMFAKKGDDAIKIDGDNIVITMNNVINPINADDVPDELNKYFEILGDETPLAGKDKPDVFPKMKMVWGDQEYTADNYKKTKGKTLNVGEKVTFYIPNTVGWATGEKHKITVKIHQDRPIAFSIERKIE